MRITPPIVPNLSGQFFLKDPLETAAWEADIKVILNSYQDLLNTPTGQPIDLFAIWYLTNNPADTLANKESSHWLPFGYSRRFMGVGLFIFREGKDYYLIAMEDQGLERIALTEMANKMKPYENSCHIPSALIENGFNVRLLSQQSMLQVTLF